MQQCLAVPTCRTFVRLLAQSFAYWIEHRPAVRPCSRGGRQILRTAAAAKGPFSPRGPVPAYLHRTCSSSKGGQAMEFGYFTLRESNTRTSNQLVSDRTE